MAETIREEEEYKAKKKRPAQASETSAMNVTADIFLGEVLLGARMVDRYQLEEAMHLHHHEGLRVGEALMRLGAITEEDLERGLALQKNLRYIAGISGGRSA